MCNCDFSVIEFLYCQNHVLLCKTNQTVPYFLRKSDSRSIRPSDYLVYFYQNILDSQVSSLHQTWMWVSFPWTATESDISLVVQAIKLSRSVGVSETEARRPCATAVLLVLPFLMAESHHSMFRYLYWGNAHTRLHQQTRESVWTPQPHSCRCTSRATEKLAKSMIFQLKRPRSVECRPYEPAHLGYHALMKLNQEHEGLAELRRVLIWHGNS